MSTETLTVTRLTTMPRGSWKWQDAYAQAVYAPHQTRDGRWVWRRVWCGHKVSLPQARRAGDGDLPIGGLQNVELTPAERSAMTFVAAGLL